MYFFYLAQKAKKLSFLSMKIGKNTKVVAIPTFNGKH